MHNKIIVLRNETGPLTPPPPPPAGVGLEHSKHKVIMHNKIIVLRNETGPLTPRGGGGGALADWIL